ncbi:hypothetical protein QEW_1047 [Clostridioides difficile CD160]|nr:hypothetical protein QEW_1047 [Clostridioides difficile CD160]
MLYEKLDEKLEFSEKEQQNFLNLIIHAIYEQEKFKFITQRFFEVYMIKEHDTIENVRPIFEDFLSSTILSKLNYLTTPRKTKKLRSQEITSSWRIKNNWVKMALDSMNSNKGEPKLLKREYLSIRDEYLKNQGKIKSIDLDSPEQLIEMRETTLRNWAFDSFYNISDFPYLFEMSDSKIKSAFSHDLLLCITEILKAQYEYDINKIVLTTPAYIAPGIFLPTIRPRKIKNLEIVKTDDNSYVSNEYNAKDHKGVQLNLLYKFSFDFKDKNGSDIENFRTELSNSETEKKAMPKISLDKKDLAIIIYIERIFNLDTATFYLVDLLKHLGLARAKKNYDDIRERLLKLPYYTVDKSVEKGGKIKRKGTFNFFTSVDIITTESNREIVKVIRAVPPEFDRVSTDLMYENELKKLKLEQSINLAYFLEGRRNYLIRCGEDLQNKTYRFFIDNLKYEVHIDSKKTLKTNMTYLELAFNEIKMNQFIIKDYVMGKDYFDVSFYENTEKQRCLLNSIIGSLPEYINALK